jgi:hypothetical protein
VTSLTAVDDEGSLFDGEREQRDDGETCPDQQRRTLPNVIDT